MKTLDQKIKKDYVTKMFLSKGETPSQNSVIMYCVYLTNLPKDWDERILHKPSVDKVQEYFGVDYGFGNMIHWGINYDCRNSKTSKKQHIAMNTAYTLSKTLLKSGMFISYKKLKKCTI